MRSPWHCTFSVFYTTACLLAARCSCYGATLQLRSPTSSASAEAKAFVFDGADPDECNNVTNSEFNPHPRPSPHAVPWFEGWYARVTDADGTSSFGIGIGHFPGQQANLSGPAAACFILASGVNETVRLYTRNFESLSVNSPALSSQALQSPNSTSTSASTSSSGGGGVDPAAATPGGGAPVSFSLEARDPASHDYCVWRLTQGSVRIAARLGGARLRLRSNPSACAAADPWDGPSAPAPEGWLARFGFLLRLQWDVLSLGTAVHYALHEAPKPAPVPEQRQVSERDQGAMAEEVEEDGEELWAGEEAVGRPQPVFRPGLLHLEKNWGASFPDQWLWAQAHRSEPGQKASLVLAGGLLPHIFQPLIPPVRQYVLSYHPPPPAAPFALDPRDPPLFSNLLVRGCDGVFALDLYSVYHVVHVVASAPPRTFQGLPCPTADGFKNYSVESFSARLQLRVLRRPFPFAPPASARLLHEDVFEGAAMEFGGAYVCPEAMPQLAEVGMAQGGGRGARDGGGGSEREGDGMAREGRREEGAVI